MDSNKFENKADELAGAAKEHVGDATDDESLEAEGAMEKAKAKAKQTVEDAKDDLSDATQAAKDKVRSAFD